MLPALILSSDSHVFEPPDLWTRRIDAAFRDRAPRIQRGDGTDYIVVEGNQVLSGIGLILNAGARFEAPETISGRARLEDVPRGGYDPEQHLADMRLDGVAGEVLYPSQGLFYFRVKDSALMSAIFRAYNDWLAEFFCAMVAGVWCEWSDPHPDSDKENDLYKKYMLYMLARMFDDETRTLIILPRGLVDRARGLAGRAMVSLKLPVSLQIVLRALIEEGLKRPTDPGLLENISHQADTVRQIRRAARRRATAARTARHRARPRSRSSS